MKALDRRLLALEGTRSGYLTVAELLDRLDNPVADGREPHPNIVAALAALPGLNSR